MAKGKIMINAKTLAQVHEAQKHLQTARRIMETLVDVELKESEWQPGLGEKPHRVRELQSLANVSDGIIVSLDKLWS
jgi:hypothetical protein